MFYAVIVMVVLLPSTGIKITVFGQQIGYSQKEQCLGHLEKMKAYLSTMNMTDNIIKQDCMMKEKWVEYLGRDPWGNEKPKQPGQEASLTPMK